MENRFIIRIIRTILLSSVLISSTNTLGSSDFEDRLEELEMKSMLNSVQIGGELILRHDQISKNTNARDGSTYETVNFNVDRLRLRLNLMAELSDRVTFYGRLTTSKAQNEIFPDARTSDDALNKDQNARAFRGAEMYLERAYFNVKITDDLVFTAGRLPIVDGPPYHLSYGEAPLGSYPLLSYHNNFEGYALTYSIGDLTLRGVYHPWSQFSRNSNNSPNPAFGQNGRLMGIGDVKVFNADYTFKNSGLARTITVMGQYMFADNLQVGDQPALEGNLASFFSGDYGTSNLSFDLKLSTAYLELFDIANSGFSLAMSHLKSIAENRGTLYQEIAAAQNIGFYSNTENETVTGSATHVVASYNLPLSSLNHPTLGVEYNTMEKGAFYPNNNPIDPLRMLNTYGTVQHMFYVQPIDPYLKLRLGYIATDPTHSNAAFGEPQELQGDAAKGDSVAYAELRLKF